MTTLPATEREIENSIRDLFLRAGWYPAKTDSGMVARGTRARVSRGHLPLGFPDLTMLRALPGSSLCLAALIEVKTLTGKLLDSQVERHAELRELYGIHPHIIRDAREAVSLIKEAHRIAAILKGSCQET